MTKAKRNNEFVTGKHVKEIFNRPRAFHLKEQASDLHYDYERRIASEEKRSYLKNATIQVRTLHAQSIGNVVEMGRYLEHVQNDILNHGEYMAWLKEEFEKNGYFSADSASNYRNAYALAQKFGLDKIKSLKLSYIYIVGRHTVPEEAQAEVIEKASRGELKTKKEIYDIILHHKQEKKTT